MSNPNPPTAAAAAPRWWRWWRVIALAAYVVFLARHTAVVAGGSDSSGYLNSARLLAAGKLSTDLRGPAEFGPRGSLIPAHFMPQGFFPFTDRARLSPTYPTGLPLHFAAAGRFLGWTSGPWLVVLLAAVAPVCLCYLAARQLGLGAGLAAAGAVVLAAFPVFIFTSVQPLSDSLATAWTLGALCAGLRARAGRPWAAACGLAVGIAVLVRPTNVLLAPALLVLLGWDAKKLGLFVLGGLPAAAWLAFYNHQLYGSVFQSGYGDVLAAFATRYGAPTAVHFAKWLALLLPAASLILLLALWAAGNSWYRTPRLNVFLMKTYERAYARGSLAARDTFPPDSLVVSFAFSGALFFYTEFPVLRCDQLEAPAFTRYADLALKAGRPVRAVRFDFEEKDAFRRCPGEWSQLSRTGNVGLWQLAALKT